MGVEGAVRLALRGELAAIEDEAAREQRVQELVAAVRAQSTALNAATYFELDDVIDPADTRARLVQTLRRRRRSHRRTRSAGAAARWSTPGETGLLSRRRAPARPRRDTPPASAPRPL